MPKKRRSCINCWSRKVKCDRQKPCSSCILHNVKESCFAETQNNNGSTKLSMFQSVEDESKRKTTARKRELNLDRMKKSIKSREESGKKGDIECSNNSTTSSPGITEIYQIESDSLLNIETSLSFIGNFQLANDWPSIDKEELDVIIDSLSKNGPLSSKQKAYLFSCLALSGITIAPDHHFKKSGRPLDAKHVETYLQQAEQFLNKVFDEVLQKEQEKPEFDDIIMIIRIVHLITWSYAYSDRIYRAQPFNELAISITQNLGITDKFGSDEKEEINLKRDKARCLILEISSMSNWIAFGTGKQTEMLNLNEDVLQWPLIQLNLHRSLSTEWCAWKLHSSTWMKRVLEFSRGKDNEDSTNQQDRAYLVSSLLDQMKEEEKKINTYTGLLKQELYDINDPKIRTNSLIMRRSNAQISARLSALVFKCILTETELSKPSTENKIALEAIFSASEIFRLLPFAITMLRSSFSFPTLKVFIPFFCDVGMKTATRAVNRIPTLTVNDSLMLPIIDLLAKLPLAFDILNEFGSASGTALSVLTNLRTVPIPRALSFFGSDGQKDEVGII